MQKENFIVGCNLPWLEGRMGWDIAYHQEWGYGFDFTSAEDAFSDLHKMGVKVVRWWLFTDCRAGIVFDCQGFPVRIQDEVKRHMDIVMNEICPRYQIKMYWCLLSSLSRGEHFDIITNQEKRTAYIKNILVPLAKRYKDKPTNNRCSSRNDFGQ